MDDSFRVRNGELGREDVVGWFVKGLIVMPSRYCDLLVKLLTVIYTISVGLFIRGIWVAFTNPLETIILPYVPVVYFGQYPCPGA